MTTHLSRHRFITRLHDALRQRLRVPPGTRLCVAVSGGIDSQTLLTALAKYPPAGSRYNLSAVHIHHGMVPNADAMAEQARTTADALGVPFFSRTVDVPRERLPGESWEAAARRLRHGAFAAVLREAGSPTPWLVQAHHEDDQAETVLMMLMEGTGLPGLRGIPEQRPFTFDLSPDGSARTTPLIRPILTLPRAILAEFASHADVRWVEDASNVDTQFLRNRVRHSVLPFLREHGNAGVSAHLAALAHDARDWSELAEAWQDREWQACHTVTDQGLVLDGRALAALPVVVRNGLLLRAFRDIGFPARSLSRGLLQEIAERLTVMETGKTDSIRLPRPPHVNGQDLPDCLRITPAGDILFPLPGRQKTPPGPPMAAVSVPGVGEYALTAWRGVWRLSLSPTTATAALQELDRAASFPRLREFAAVAREDFPLTWRPGDLHEPWQLVGATHATPLGELLRSRGVAPELRIAWPVVVDSKDRPVWVPLVGVTEAVRVQATSPHVVAFCLTDRSPWPEGERGV